MTALRILVLLAGVVSTLLFPVFVGHALSTHESGPVLYGGIGLLLGAVLIFVSARLPDSAGNGH
jgi:hypothetical protein